MSAWYLKGINDPTRHMNNLSCTNAVDKQETDCVAETTQAADKAWVMSQSK